MNKINTIEKKLIKRFILFLIMLVPIAITFFIGLNIYKNQPNDPTSEWLFILTLSSFVILIVGYDLSTIKYRKQMLIANRDLINQKINTFSGIKEFKSIDDKLVMFKTDGLYINNKCINYSFVTAEYVFTSMEKLFSNAGMLCIIIGDNETKTKIEVNGDLIIQLNENAIEIINKDDFNILINNFDCKFRFMYLLSKDHYFDIPIKFKKLN